MLMGVLSLYVLLRGPCDGTECIHVKEVLLSNIKIN